ncbi:MAG: hypothetical protein RJB38_1380 [Pseudomonadota bacterium]|jgi:hypothetical protein
MSIVGWVWAGVLVVVLSLLPRRSVGGRRWFYLRVLFPSWRFFESLGTTARLEIRTRHEDLGWGAWRPAIKIPERGWLSWVLNPAGNRAFAEQSAVEHLVSEVESHELVPEALLQSVTYQVVQRIAQEAAGREWVQFRILLRGSPDESVSESVSDRVTTTSTPILNRTDQQPHQELLISPPIAPEAMVLEAEASLLRTEWASKASGKNPR